MRNGKRHILAYATVAALMLLCISPATATVPASAPAREIDFVLTQCEDALKRVQTLSYTYEVQSSTSVPGQRIQATFKGEVRRDGQRRYIREHRHSRYLDAGDTIQDVDTIAFFGDRESGCWPAPAPVELVEHENLSQLSDREIATRKNYFAWDRFDLAWSEGKGSLRQFVAERYPGFTVEWTAVQCDSESGSAKLFRLSQHTMGLAKPPRFQLDADPARGFIIVRRAYYFEDGRPQDEVRITPSHDESSGLWYPSEWKETRWTAETPQQTDTVITCRLSDVRINQKVSETSFSFKSLNVPSGTKVIRCSPMGKLNLWVQTPNGLQPVEEAPIVVASQRTMPMSRNNDALRQRSSLVTTVLLGGAIASVGAFLVVWSMMLRRRRRGTRPP